nr:carboxypeptidase-like regulatory domain-containing protein [uncultured Mucilaginibacter sp.]
MRKLFYFLLLLVCVSAKAQQTYNITGVITDEKDAPIPGATVFIGDSQKATATDSDGKFTLRQVRSGKYNLVVKMIGYVITNQEFTIQNKDLKFRVKLPESNLLLNTVNISFISKSDREKYIETFKRCFFGTSDDARDCKIQNADIIKFNYNTASGVLRASTDDFLIIENRVLGYRIKYLLSNFSYDSENPDGIVSFAGRLFFEDLPGDARQKKRWEEARVDAYLGSLPHFFCALYNDELEKNGFVVYQMLNKQARNTYARKRQLIPSTYNKPYTSLARLVANADDGLKKLDLSLLKKDSTELYVVYRPKPEPKDFFLRGAMIDRFFRTKSGQLSLIRPVQDSVIISRNGDLSPSNSMIKGGFWAWGQMASFIPSDYTLPGWVQLDKDGKLLKQ